MLHNSRGMASRALRRRSTYRSLGRHGKSRSHPLLRIVLVVLVGIIMLTSGASAGTIFFYGQNLPTLKNFKQRFEWQNTIIRDYNLQPLYDMADMSKHRGKRVVEPLQATGSIPSGERSWLVPASPQAHGIPIVLQDATVATEDATFYSNLGFDPMSIVRAEYDNLVHGHIVSGASTITQQLVREYMLNDNPTLSRKAEEIVLAAELTQKYPKSEILYYYLNSVPYGPVAYGAEAAAQQYFNRHVWQLGYDPKGRYDFRLALAQSALIAGLPEGPSLYDPVNNLPAAKSRMHYVLHLMCSHGYLHDPGDPRCDNFINSVMALTRTWHFSPPSTIRKYPHFVEYALTQLRQLSQTVPALKGRLFDGLDVQTTLDPRLQNLAQQTVSKQIAGLQGQHVTDGALVSMDLRPSCYGCVRAMVGSADYNNTSISGQINMADTPRQPGSSFKPFNYVLAFMNGLGPGTTVNDAPIAIPDQGNTQDGGWYQPTNYDHTFHGVVTLRTALTNSLNIPAIKVEQFNASQSQDGLQSIEHMAIQMGLTSFARDNPNCCGWALTLGGVERGARLVEETSAFGTFASGGYRVPPIAILRVWDRTTRKLLYYASPFKTRPQKPVIDPAYAYVMTNVLSDNASRCAQVCEFGLDSPLNLGRPAAAKTGTTNAYTDNWTVGYTPDIVTGVWVGNADNTPMIDSTGITGAAPIWHDFMTGAFALLNLPPKDFGAAPPGVEAGSECRLSSTYYSLGTGYYDIFAGRVPLCSIAGTGSAVVPQDNGVNQAPAPQPVVPQAPAPAAPTAVPVVPTAAPAAPVLQPTAQPQSQGPVTRTNGSPSNAVPGVTAVP